MSNHTALDGLNKAHCIDNREGMARLPEKCANLIISDPPYYRVKGAFDFVFRDFAHYLEFMEEQAVAYKRILADNGTLFVWGMDRKIAYVQTVFDKYFELLGTLVWEKPSIANEWDTRRTFPERGQERLLMYSNEIGRTGLEEIKLDINNFQPLRQYFKDLQAWMGAPKSLIIQQVGQKADHTFRHSSTQWDLPTPETYAQLIEYFGIDAWEGFRQYETLRQEYETLRQEYETIRRPFNNHLKLTDVLRFSQESHVTKLYKHPTKKPEKLTTALIETCSRPGDLVVVPFAGSGTECAMAAKTGRNFIAFDTEAEYVDMTNQRARTHLQAPRLSYAPALSFTPAHP